jgi:hypothetical protein
MLRHIDHIVILVRDLDEASAGYSAAGFTVVPGGVHAGGATHNALVGFADGAYLELIAFTEPDKEVPHRWWRRLAKGEGFVDYALLSDNLDDDAAAMRTRKVDVEDPVVGGRDRPDGQHVGWKNLHLTAAPARMALPFVIEDTTARSLRVPSGDTAAHPNGAAGVSSLTLIVTDLPAAVRRLGAVLGHPGEPTFHEAGDAHTFRVGLQDLVLLHPTDAASEAGQHLKDFGDSPYELVLSAGGADLTDHSLLPLDQTHGARIRVGP